MIKRAGGGWLVGGGVTLSVGPSYIGLYLLLGPRLMHRINIRINIYVWYYYIKKKKVKIVEDGKDGLCCMLNVFVGGI